MYVYVSMDVCVWCGVVANITLNMHAVCAFLLCVILVSWSALYL